MSTDNLTYGELAEEIANMTHEQRCCNVTVYVPGIDEHYPVDVISFATESLGVLDEDHPILNIANGE